MRILKIEFELHIFRWAPPNVRQYKIGKGLERIADQVSDDFWISAHSLQVPVVANETPSQSSRGHGRYGDYRR